ncbi:MAG: SseB family protein [Propionicimonas sp.]
MKVLGQPNASFAGDRGEPDSGVRALIEAVAGDLSYARAIAALCGTRLLLPIAEDPEADLSAVMMRSGTGETGLLVFTGLDSLQAWNPRARPVPCTLDDVAATAVESACHAIVVDVAGPTGLVIESPLIAELAAGRRLVELDDGGFGWLFLQDGPGSGHQHPGVPEVNAPVRS